MSSEPAAERAAIEDIVRRQGEAWNRADAAAFGEHYAEDGSFTNISGAQIYGKAGFVELHAQIFHSIFAGTHISFRVGRIHFLRPDVAIADIDAFLANLPHALPGVSLDRDGVLYSKLQEVLAKNDGRWTIAAFHNVAVAPKLTR